MLTRTDGAKELRKQGNAAFVGKRFALAREAYLSALQRLGDQAGFNDDNTLRLDLEFKIACCLKEEGSWVEAEKHLDVILRQEPNHVRALHDMSLCRFVKDDHAGAFGFAQEAERACRGMTVPLSIPALFRTISCIEVRDCQHGKGLFARRSMVAGQCVLKEAPLVQALTCYSERDTANGMMEPQLMEMIRSMEGQLKGGADLTVRLAIALVLAKKDAEFVARHAARAHNQGWTGWVPLLSKQLSMEPSRVLDLLACVEANAFSFFSPYTRPRGGSLFDMASFTNNRCKSPNCEWFASPYEMRIVAVRAIAVDEEITISYIPLSSLGQHKAPLNFECKCTDCSVAIPVLRRIPLSVLSAIQNAANDQVGSVLAKKFDAMRFDDWLLAFLTEVDVLVFAKPLVVDDPSAWPDFSPLYNMRKRIFQGILDLQRGGIDTGFLLSSVTMALVLGSVHRNPAVIVDPHPVVVASYLAFPAILSEMHTGLDRFERSSCQFHFDSSILSKTVAQSPFAEELRAGWAMTRAKAADESGFK
jgi:hypothetical protein